MADITVVAANVRPLEGALTRRFEAGGALSVGDAVYINADGEVEEADASAVGTAYASGLVVSAPDGKTSAVEGEWVDVLLYGPVVGFSGMTPNDVLYLSNTAGALADAAGDNSHKVARALSATIVLWDPALTEA